MPTYDYTCYECGTAAAITASITEAVKPPKCEKCKKAMSRNFGVGAIKFNGKDFAINQK